MEKGFNDEELADIMNEIESLEREFADDSAPSDQGVLAQLAEKTIEASVPKTNYEENKVVSMARTAPATNKSNTNSPVGLQFQVHGQMELNMNFQVSGQDVALTVSEQGLSITLDGGATFTVPLKNAQAAKKAA